MGNKVLHESTSHERAPLLGRDVLQHADVDAVCSGSVPALLHDRAVLTLQTAMRCSILQVLSFALVTMVLRYVWPSEASNCIAPAPDALVPGFGLCEARYVPRDVFFGASCAYLAMICLAIPTAIFSTNSGTAPLHVLEMAICVIAGSSFLLEWQGLASVHVSPSGLEILTQRYVAWGHTVPLLSLGLGLASGSTTKAIMRNIMVISASILSGALASFQVGVAWAILFSVSCVTFVAFIANVTAMFCEVARYVRSHAETGTKVGGTYVVLAATIVCWSSFGVAWTLHQCLWISTGTMEASCAVFDVLTKIVFSRSITSINVYELAVQRLATMRAIEASSAFKTVETLRSAVSQRDGMISSLSHELRTPMNGIIGVADSMLARRDGDEKVRREVLIMRSSAHRLLTLINDIVDAASIREQKLRLRRERVRVRAIASEVVELAQYVVRRRISLRNEVPVACVILGDSVRLSQVLNNLVGNAAKFTKQGSIVVGARAIHECRHWEIFVKDTGIGIPADRHEAIFEAFEQASDKTAASFGGTGLGLSITKSLVLAQQGTVHVESVVGKGSTFIVTLPASRGSDEDRPSAPSAQPGRQTTTTDSGGLERILSLDRCRDTRSPHDASSRTAPASVMAQVREARPAKGSSLAARHAHLVNLKAIGEAYGVCGTAPSPLRRFVQPEEFLMQHQRLLEQNDDEAWRGAHMTLSDAVLDA